MIKSISDNKNVGNRKAYIICLESTRRLSFLSRKAHTRSEAGCLFRRTSTRKERVRPGIDDILYDEHIATPDRCFQILGDSDLP